MKKNIICLLFLCLVSSSAYALPQCYCTDGLDGDQQIECDESKNYAGSSVCYNDCECTKGRECKKEKHKVTGYCNDKK